jgi:hypothetical protein
VKYAGALIGSAVALLGGWMIYAEVRQGLAAHTSYVYVGAALILAGSFLIVPSLMGELLKTVLGALAPYLPLSRRGDDAGPTDRPRG